MPKISRSPERSQQRTVDESYSLEPMSELHDAQMTQEVAQYFKDNEPRFSKFTKTIAATAIGTIMYGATLLGGDIANGIHEGKAAVSDSHAEVHDIYTDVTDLYPLYRTHATFVLTGLGTKDPSKTAEALAIHHDVGRVFGIEYSNKDLNTLDIATRTIETARANNITEISLDGYSAGGPIGIDVAAHIHRLAPEIKIIAIMLNSSPLGKDSLTAKSRDGIDIMESIMDINEDFAYYEHGHIAVETFNRNAAYLERTDVPYDELTVTSWNKVAYNKVAYTIDYSKAIEEVRSVADKLNGSQAASARLIQQQARHIVRSDYRNNIKDLPDDVLFMYTRSEDSAADTVVDVENGEKAFIDVMEELERPFKVLRAGVGHANPSEALEAYTTMIRESIHPEITRRLLVLMIKQEATRLESLSEVRENKALQRSDVQLDTPN